MIWTARAPSNIALIKYMGKIAGTENRPTNASFSYTLDHLWCEVQLELTRKPVDEWIFLEREDITSMNLSEKGAQRFLAHLSFLKSQFNFNGNFLVRSGNNFPADCGLASSAASFAALTRVASVALAELTQQALPEVMQQANWSRAASGSSCRSFYSPWCLWTNEGVKEIVLPYKKLIHRVLVVDQSKKLVSSSEAHKRVSSSLLFQNRPERAEIRLQEILFALQSQDWQMAYQLCWQEFWDMHALFETSQPSFGYLTDKSMRVLMFLKQYWEKHQDGPLITMDAGPNIHLLFRADQTQVAAEIDQKLHS